jgi:hypothetical protein
MARYLAGAYVMAALMLGCGETKPEPPASTPAGSSQPPKSDAASPTPKQQEVRTGKSARTEVTPVETAPPAAPPKSLLEATPDFVVTTSEIRDASDKSKAGEYDGKVLEVTGKILTFAWDWQMPALRVMSSEETGGRFVPCCFPSGFPWMKAVPGQIVTLRGRGMNKFNFYLADCEIVKAEGERGPETTVEKLVSELDTDVAGAVAKYTGKHCILSGEVAEVEKDRLILKSAGDWKLKVNFEFSRKKQSENVKPGDTITAIGEVAIAPGIKELFLRDAELLSGNETSK